MNSDTVCRRARGESEPTESSRVRRHIVSPNAHRTPAHPFFARLATFRVVSHPNWMKDDTASGSGGERVRRAARAARAVRVAGGAVGGDALELVGDELVVLLHLLVELDVAIERNLLRDLVVDAAAEFFRLVVVVRARDEEGLLRIFRVALARARTRAQDQRHGDDSDE